MISPPPSNPFDTAGAKPNKNWIQWMQKAWTTLKKDKGVGATGDRPTNGIAAGDYFFDTTLGTPIWYDGSNWIDATGATV